MIHIHDNRIRINTTPIMFASARIEAGALVVRIRLPYRPEVRSNWWPCTEVRG